MCGTPEEFLAAFRRYVDRQGLFVPTAAPIAAGLRGRFAVTLIDGGILIEGVAEVVSSSPRPSALYGRTGMVLAFAEVDEPSRETLTTLDKAKLSLKAQNLGAHLVPRPGTLREPVTHPEVKLPSAASDRVLALAECVVVGEISELEPVVGRRAPTAKPMGAPVSSRLPQRFPIPQIQSAPLQSAPPPRAESERPVKERTDLSGRVVNDLPGDATEVGPIVAVEEGMSQPSGPTLTNPVLVPPLRRSAPLIEPELESTLGGLPPVAPIDRASTSQSGPAVSRASTSQSGPAVSRTSTNQSGPVPPVNAAPSRPSQRAVVSPRAGTDSTLRSPAEAVADPSGPVERRPQIPAIPRTLTPIPVPSTPRAATAPAPSGPMVSRAPTPHPLAPAIPRTLTPAMALRQDASGANKAPRGSTESGFGNVPMRMPDRPSQATVRKTSIGIAAVHVEPAPAEPPPRPADAAVPQLIHDSMFATEDATDDGDAEVADAADLAQSAVPLPADQQATRREGLGARSLPRAAPSRASAPSLPGLTAEQVASPAERLRPPPADDAALPSMPHGTPPPREAPRLGRSSAPLEVPSEVPIEVDVHLDDPLGEDTGNNEDDLQTELSPSLPESEPTAAPLPTTRPSQPTVPIRPPAELATLGGAPAERTAAAPPRRDSVRALPGVSPSELSASAPLAVEDASFATVPTTAPHLPGAPPHLEAPTAEDGPPQRKSQPAMPPLRRSQQAISFGEPAAVASFSDPGSVSAPLPAVSAERPPLVAEAGAPALEAAVEHSARHAPPPAPAAPAGPGAKIEIDPALYAESAIDRSFEHNFVVSGAEQRPWQDVPTPWNSPASAPVVAPVQPAAPYDYQPYPGYDPSYPVSISSGDETALVAAPDVHRSRTLVIIGSAILVLLAGLAAYLYWDRQQNKPADTPSEVSSQAGDPQHAPDGSAATGSAAPAPGSAAAPPDNGEAATGEAKGDGAAPAGAPAPSGNDAKAAPPSDAPGSNDAEAARPSDATATEPSCTVTFHSTPAGAAVGLDGKELGVTPFTKAVPCKGGELTFRKGSAAPVVQRQDTFTEGQKIEAKLTEVAAKGKIEITVVTTPVAARIRLNNKEIGRSPVTIEVPAGVPIVLSAQKDGRAASVRVTPSARATSFTLDLKRAVRPPRKASGGGPGLDEI